MSEYTLFLDESGRATTSVHISDPREKRLFIAVGVAIENKHLGSLDKKCTELIGRGNVELHYRDINQQEGEFSYLKNDVESRKLFRDVVSFMCEIDARLYVTIMDRPVYDIWNHELKKHDPHRLTYVHMICRFAYFLKNNNHVGFVRYDEHKFEKELVDILSDDADSNRVTPPTCAESKHTIRDAIGVNSKDSRGVQFADICAGLMRRRHMYNDKKFNDYMKVLYHNKKNTSLEPRWLPSYDFNKPIAGRRMIVCPNPNNIHDDYYKNAVSTVRDYINKSGDDSEKFLVHVHDKYDIYTETKDKLPGDITGNGSEHWECKTSAPLDRQQGTL